MRSGELRDTLAGLLRGERSGEVLELDILSLGVVGVLAAILAVKVVAPPEHRTLAFLRVRAHGFARAKEVLLGPNETAPKRRGRNET